MLSRVYTVIVVVFCVSVVPSLSANCNRDKKNALIRQYDLVVFGNEVNWKDYVVGIGAIITDIIGGGGAATSTFLKEQLGEQISKLGLDTVQNLLFNGGVLEINGGKVRGGILTYHCKNWTYKCCCKGWKCGCFKKCGKWTWPEPNAHQPYIAYKRN